MGRQNHRMLPDEHIMAFHGLEEVSLTTLQGRTLVPMQLGDYQRVRFLRTRGQADLVLLKGVFYLLVTLETPEAPPMTPERFLGVDLGIVNLAVDSDAHTYTGDDVEAVRQRCQTHRQTFQARGTKKTKRRLRQLAGKEARFRRWVNHYISAKLVAHAKDTKAALAMEDLTGIRDRITVRKGQRNKQSGWSFRQLREFIVYKARRAGVPVVFVDPRHSSRTCRRCGYVDKRNRRSQAEFSCLRCGHTCHADLNGASILAQRATVSRPDLVAPSRGQLAFAW